MTPPSGCIYPMRHGLKRTEFGGKLHLKKGPTCSTTRELPPMSLKGHDNKYSMRTGNFSLFFASVTVCCLLFLPLNDSIARSSATMSNGSQRPAGA